MRPILSHSQHTNSRNLLYLQSLLYIPSMLCLYTRPKTQETAIQNCQNLLICHYLLVDLLTHFIFVVLKIQENKRFRSFGSVNDLIQEPFLKLGSWIFRLQIFTKSIDKLFSPRGFSSNEHRHLLPEFVKSRVQRL